MTSGTVYVLYVRADLAGALYKIGATASLDQRLASYRALLGDVEPTTLIPCDDVYAAEKALHASLSHCRYEGRSGPQGGRKSELFYLTQRELRALSAIGHIHADGGIKDRLVPLVGWARRSLSANAILRSERAYDVAYDRLYEVLPSCRNCLCL